MQMRNSTGLPNAVAYWLTAVIDNFNSFKNQKIISIVDYYVTPVGGDLSFAIVECDNNIYTIVTTDYPDPLYDQITLEKLSKKYHMSNIVTPEGQAMPIQDNDGYAEIFFIEIRDTRYYCAKLNLI